MTKRRQDIDHPFARIVASMDLHRKVVKEEDLLNDSPYIGKKMRQSIWNAFQNSGGESYLMALAHEHPEQFTKLITKLVPTESTMNHNIGDDLSTLIEDLRNDD